MKSLKTFKTFDDFWPFYMSQHADPANRRIHFVGTLIVHLILLHVFATAQFKILWLLPLVGYGLPWVGHLIAEKNNPVFFKHPLWSMMGDFRMFYLILLKKL